MAKFHINPTTGRVNICRADDSKAKGCPFGGPSDHYSSKEDARAAYEQKNETFQTTPLKKLSSKEKEELALKADIEKWGPRGKGASVDGLNSDDAFEARKLYASETIEKFELTPESSTEEVAEAAHKAGIVAGFLKNQIGAKAFEANRAKLKKDLEEKRANAAAKKATVAVPNSSFEIDSEWTRIPGEGHFKFIKSTSGKETASIQIRDGFYMLGARDEAGGFVYFQENSFISENEAIDYLKRNEKLLKI